MLRDYRVKVFVALGVDVVYLLELASVSLTDLQRSIVIPIIIFVNHYKIKIIVINIITLKIGYLLAYVF